MRQEWNNFGSRHYGEDDLGEQQPGQRMIATNMVSF
jgi:hypothetical protein